MDPQPVNRELTGKVFDEILDHMRRGSDLAEAFLTRDLAVKKQKLKKAHRRTPDRDRILKSDEVEKINLYLKRILTHQLNEAATKAFRVAWPDDPRRVALGHDPITTYENNSDIPEEHQNDLPPDLAADAISGDTSVGNFLKKVIRKSAELMEALKKHGHLATETNVTFYPPRNRDWQIAMRAIDHYRKFIRETQTEALLPKVQRDYIAETRPTPGEQIPRETLQRPVSLAAQDGLSSTPIVSSPEPTQGLLFNSRENPRSREYPD